jgi:uncharacterized protein (TIGR02391 family)
MSNSTLLLQEQIERAEALKKLPKHSPQYNIWYNITAKIIRDNFNSEYMEMFNKTGLRHLGGKKTPAEAKRAFLNLLDEKVQFLQSIIDEYNRFQNNPALDISRATPLDTYDFHQAVKLVSITLYENKHYAQAVEEAFKRMIQEVKRIVKEKTNQEYDGDDLMNGAFSLQNPIIKFNQLQSTEDRDEQKGMMFLFRGIVGIRNKKAHTNVILNDSARAIEYLSLASLLMRLLDQFAV